MAEGGPKIQTCSFKVGKSWRRNIQHGEYVNNTILYFENSYSYKKKFIICKGNNVN